MPMPPIMPPLMGTQPPQTNTSQNSQNTQSQNKPQPLMSLMSIPFENKNSTQPQQKSLLGPPPSNLQPIQQQAPTPLMSIKPNGKQFMDYFL